MSSKLIKKLVISGVVLVLLVSAPWIWTTTAALAGVVVAPHTLSAASRRLARMDAAAFDAYALQLLKGFVRNARRTAPGYAVCDFAGGTLVPSCVTPSGKTYASMNDRC